MFDNTFQWNWTNIAALISPGRSLVNPTRTTSFLRTSA
jgi:hypothetical protein